MLNVYAPFFKRGQDLPEFKEIDPDRPFFEFEEVLDLGFNRKLVIHRRHFDRYIFQVRSKVNPTYVHQFTLYAEKEGTTASIKQWVLKETKRLENFLKDK